MKNLIVFIFVFLFSFLLPGNLLARDHKCCTADCSQIKDDEERLKCFDNISGRKPGKAKKVSYLTELWELDKKIQRSKYAIMTHRSCYMLPFAYNSSPNEEPYRDANSDLDVKETEVKFQLSFKVKLWQDLFGRDMDLWFGYTQKSLWQLYNYADSSPFRETNYEPELLLNYRMNYKLPGINLRLINFGFNHQSNGRSEPLSRSWNRIVGNLGFERENFTLLLKTWYRLPESTVDDDNPDMDDYLGYGEIWVYYFIDKFRIGVMLRNSLKVHNNRGAIQLEFAFPIFEKVGGYIQFFNGYGESLLDYNHSINRIGAGFILLDWD